MAWFHELQFISAVPMPEDIAEAYGTTINGMWCAPEIRTDSTIAKVHAAGGRVLFSVPLIALTPKVYHQPEFQNLVKEACRDIDGNPSLVPWYYWESEPVYSICFYSSSFRRYLLERCKVGIERGMDVVNLDEINTSLGLMDRKPGGSGFCSNCLSRFRNYIKQSAGSLPGLEARLAEADDDSLRKRLREDDALYKAYLHFHERQAYDVAVDFIKELRSFAQTRNSQFAITANLAYLGNVVPMHGDLWGPMWGEQIDFVMMENIYEPVRGGGHLLLPRGKFTAWYRLASAFTPHAPAWICPSIMVPKQMAGESRLEYYLLMFVESYANNGRFGYYWWPGVDVETRLKATAPEMLKDYIRFFKRNRAYLDQVSTDNSLAVLYLNGSMRVRPEAHFKYLALAQALSETGYQYDVIYGGDDIYSPGDLDFEKMSSYQAILVPEAGHLTETQKETLARFSNLPGHDLILFGSKQPGPGFEQAIVRDESMLFSFWKDYQDEDRQRIAACVTPFVASQILTSHPLVNVIRYVKEGKQILHFVNYDYNPIQDRVPIIENLRVNHPWEGETTPGVRWMSLDGESQLAGSLKDERLSFEVPRLAHYGLAILE